MHRTTSGGGWAALRYALHTARKAGGVLKLYRALRTRNACKTCALGMGGQKGGMVNERGQFPEVCKKSMQAMAADMQGAIPREFFEKLSIDQLRTLSPRELEHAGRLAEPLLAGPDDTHYRPITWDEASDHCVERLVGTQPDENFFYFSGRASNEAAFLWQLFARLYGTNNVNNCSYYCHQASGVGLSSVVGSGTATIELEDLHRCDLVFLVGGNPASNHPRMMSMLDDLRRRGGHVVVINPLVETGLVQFRIPSKLRSMLFGSKIASHYIQPQIGGDIALLTGIAKRVVEIDAIEPTYLRDHVEGGSEFIDHLRGVSWDAITRESGVDARSICEIAEVYARSKATVFAWTMGVTHHRYGADNVRAIANLALLRGMVGREGAGLMPIRGHSNVQGVGSVGVTPKLRQAVFDRLESHFGVRLPTTPGMDTLACIDAMHEGSVRNAFCLGGNLFGSNPDASATTRAFERLDSIAYVSTTLNTGHAWGRAAHTLILPVKTRDEEAQSTTQESMFNYVRLSDGGPARLAGPRSEIEIVAHIARRVLGSDSPVDWRAMEQHHNIRAAIAAIIPGFEKIGRIDETREEFQIEGRTLHVPRFATASGRARMRIVELPDLAIEPGHLRLMTIRSEGQFNTVVYEEEDTYRNQERRDVILLNEQDMIRLGIRENQPVRVWSGTGEMTDILARAYAIPPGNAAMYFPEANVLVPRIADPESRTPAFKSVAITVEPAPTAVRLPVAGAAERSRVHAGT